MPPHDPAADRRNPARALNRVARLITRHFDRRFAGEGVNVAYLSVLGPLGAVDHLPQKTLAAAAGASQPAMAELLARMVKEGLVERLRDPVDKRQTLFRLTLSARALMPRIEAGIVQGNAEVFAPLSAGERETLLALLARIETRLETL